MAALNGSTGWNGKSGNGKNNAKNRRKAYIENSNLFNPLIFGRNRMRRYRKSRDLPF